MVDYLGGGSLRPPVGLVDLMDDAGKQDLFMGGRFGIQIEATRGSFDTLNLAMVGLQHLERTLRDQRRFFVKVRDQVMIPSIKKNFEVGGRYDYEGAGRMAVVPSSWWSEARDAFMNLPKGVKSFSHQWGKVPTETWSGRVKWWTEKYEDDFGEEQKVVRKSGPGDWPAISLNTLFNLRTRRTSPAESWPPLYDTGELRKQALMKKRWTFSGVRSRKAQSMLKPTPVFGSPTASAFTKVHIPARSSESKMSYGNWPGHMHYAVQHDLGAVDEGKPPRPFAVVQDPADVNRIEGLMREFVSDAIRQSFPGMSRGSRGTYFARHGGLDDLTMPWEDDPFEVSGLNVWDPGGGATVFDDSGDWGF